MWLLEGYFRDTHIGSKGTSLKGKEPRFTVKPIPYINVVLSFISIYFQIKIPHSTYASEDCINVIIIIYCENRRQSRVGQQLTREGVELWKEA